MSSKSPISLIINHKSSQYDLSLFSSDTLLSLQVRLEELTSIPPPLQKLLYKGKKAKTSDEQTLAEAGLKDGVKIMLLGSTEQEVGGVKAAEAEKKKTEDIMRQREARGPTKVRSTATPSKASAQFKFHRIEPLAHLPSPESALSLLQRLSSDPAIAHVMRVHEFAIGLLTELAPHEHPHLLGLNQNAGQMIKLRLRTDAYDGFRTYKDVRRVLCHELTHCVWGDHDDNFKTLNSQLNREVAEFERAAAEGINSLSSLGAVYEPELEAEAHARLMGGSYVLGGASLPPPAPDSREERRRRILDATTSRLRQEEQTIEDMCGSAGPGTSNS